MPYNDSIKRALKNRALFWLCSGVTFLSSVRARSIFCGVGAVIAKHTERKTTTPEKPARVLKGRTALWDGGTLDAESVQCDVGKRKDFLKGLISIDNEKRVNWNKVRADYIIGMTLKGLAEKYGISFSSVQKRCIREKWTDTRKAAKIKVDEYVIQKTSEKVADNATLAADIKRKGLLLLNKLFDDYMQYTVTEHRESKEPGTVDVKRLRDLTAAYKDLTEDIQAGSNATNELLQSLLDMERRAGA